MSETSETRVVTKIERSPKGLVEALFNAIDKLNAGLASPEDVRAVSHTARSVANIARLEIDAVKLADALGRNVRITSLPGLGVRNVVQGKDNDSSSGTTHQTDGE